MRLSLAFVLSLALAHATEQPNHTTIRQRQVRRNDTGEPQRIKKLDRESITVEEKKQKKHKEPVVEEEKESKRKKSARVEEEGKKDKERKNVEAEDKKGSKRSKDTEETETKSKDKKEKEEEPVKKEKRSVDQKELKNQLKEMQDVETTLDAVTIDLGDILGNGGRSVDVGGTSQKLEKESKREQKKNKESSVEIAQEESFVGSSSSTVEEINTSPSFSIAGGRHKHVGFGRKKGLKRTVGGRGRGRGGQKLEGSISSAKAGKEEEMSSSRFQSSAKAGKEEEMPSFRANKYRAGGKHKTKTRGGSGKLRNAGGHHGKDSKKTSTKISTRGATIDYEGKARKML
ncbi:hypothetical protein ACHAWO_003243 [Cyclotella atomus]|uniref:Uncharacterized protein n=1 Tax=Cyclotella atomus TaxID=382360 RepID=A0ABD3Q7Q9_9STRA